MPTHCTREVDELTGVARVAGLHGAGVARIIVRGRPQRRPHGEGSCGEVVRKGKCLDVGVDPPMPADRAGPGPPFLR